MNIANIEKDGNVAVIWFDLEGEKVNKISPVFIDYMEDIIHAIEQDDTVNAVVLASKKKDFIAGADIDYFLHQHTPGTWEPIGTRASKLLRRIEQSPKPIVAAINGAAMGAGLEIILACHYRICSDAKNTKFALPEVQLGLLPGAGGTQRLPKLVGLQVALDMMLTGKNIYARKAKKLGLVDHVVNPYVLVKAAKQKARELVSRPMIRKEKRSITSFLENNKLSQNVIINQARKMVMDKTMGNYPAPIKILECVEIGLQEGVNEGYRAEIKKFEELLNSTEAKNLMRIFKNMNDLKNNPQKDLAKPVDTIGMIGAGFMGAGIAEITAAKGMKVMLKDVTEEGLASAKQTIWKNLSKKVKKKAMSQLEADLQMQNINTQLNFDYFHRADMVIEAVFEDMDLKHKILQDCEIYTHDNCIFATNTSSLPITQIAAKAKKPELVIGLHYFSPVPKMPLLEIIKTEKTADWVVATALDFGIKQGKTCIVVNDGPGFYTTRILSAMMNEALLLLEEGADILEIDQIAREFGFPVGPITLLDEVGIDVAAYIMSGDLVDRFKERGDVKTSERVIDLYKAGYKGRKNGNGFYLYKNGKKDKGKINVAVYNFFGGKKRKSIKKMTIKNRLVMSFVNEAAYCLQEGIIESARDGDVGAIFGLGFPPFLGGPFRFLDYISPDTAVTILDVLKDSCGPRFNAAQILRDKAMAASTFYDDATAPLLA